MQGTVKSYDPATKDGVLMSDVDFAEYDLSPVALEGSIFRMLRQGQRVIFDLDEDGFTLGADCDDADASVYPGAPDAPYDGIDSDCAGDSDFDADRDGYTAPGAGSSSGSRSW